MKSQWNWQALSPYILPVILFIILSFAFVSPVLQGKVMDQHDITQASSGSKELIDYRERTGEEGLWTNSMFSGMPAFQMSIRHKGNVPSLVNKFFRRAFPNPAGLLILMHIGFFILLLAFGVNPWVSAIGAIAFTFSSFNMVSLDAGHNAKMNAFAYMAPVIGSIVLAYRGKRLLGAALTALFVCLHLYANHFQMAYYLIIIILFYALAELIYAVREKQLKQFFLTSALLVLAGLLGVGPNIGRIWTTYEYANETIRGGSSELTLNKNVDEQGGLDKDYAMSFSFGPMEAFTLIIPNFAGGKSTGELDNTSNLAKRGLRGNTLKNVPLYWGSQPFTSGPAYFGVIVCFLFILGLLVVKSRHRWWILGVTILTIMLSWGKNLEAFSDLFFYYVPMYNKFRTPSMILMVASMTMPLLGMLALNEYVKGRLTKAVLKKSLYIAGGITGGIILLFGFLFAGAYDYDASIDAQLIQNGWPMDALKADRKALLQADALRSFGFFIIAFGLLFGFVKGWINQKLMLGGMAFFILIDLWAIDKRYLNSDDFVSEKKYEQKFVPTAADLQILKDKGYYRVLNTTRSTFNDALTSYYHKSIGGYHAAKLIRYQDLIENQIGRNNQAVLNMLNTKYIIVRDNNNLPVVRQNPGALGHAWFVNDYRLVESADEEMLALNDFDPKKTAIIDQRYESKLEGLTLDYNPAATIDLVEYDLKRMVYESNVPGQNDQLAVFSEIYYEGGNNDWKVFIDGQEQTHFRVNYVLRGMRVPAGKHTIEFKFEPKSFYTGASISLISSILLILALGGAIYAEVRKSEKEPEVVSK